MRTERLSIPRRIKNHFRGMLLTGFGLVMLLSCIWGGWLPARAADPQVIYFNDVYRSDYYYTGVEYLANHGVVNGYPCGGAGEPCPGLYFRPYLFSVQQMPPLGRH
jgi:hypothetical protein